MNRTTVLSVVFLLVMGYGYFDYFKFPEAQGASVADGQNDEEHHDPSLDSALKRGSFDLGMSLISRKYPRPASDWLSADKKHFQKLLSYGKFDLIVVPFQIHGYALNRTTRSQMAAQLAIEISRTTKLLMPDPYILARALGDGEREYDPEEVIRIAKNMGVKTIVWGYVGHYGRNTMSVHIQSLDINSIPKINALPGDKNTYSEKLSFTDENPPIDIYQTVIPDILKAINISTSVKKKSKHASRLNTVDFSLNPVDFLSVKSEPVLDAYIFQLLAYLTPGGAERARERFFEKSLIAASFISPSSPEYKAIKARAYLHLGRRLAGIKVLGSPETMEERALLAALNGNLQEVKTYTANIKPLIKQLFARLDENSIAASYNTIEKKDSIEIVNSLKLPGEIWQFLAYRAFTDWTSWAQFGNINFKILLDKDFPVPDFTAAGILSGATTLEDSDRIQKTADLSVLNHIRRLFESDPKKWCCQNEFRPSIIDYIDLIEAISTDNLMRRGRFLAETQGNPERAIKFLNGIDLVYKGHPEYTLLRAKTNKILAEKATGIEREALLKIAYKEAFDAMFWSRGQTIDAARAIQFISSLRRNDYVTTSFIYSKEYPFRSYYPYFMITINTDVSIHNSKLALKNSTNDFQPVLNLNWLFTEFKRDPEANEELLRSIEGRFNGSPDYASILAERGLKKDDIQSVENTYRQLIESSPGNWTWYDQLGTKFFRYGRIKDAFDLFMSYPGFKNDYKGNRVGISNNAYESGSLFYWSGHFKMAAALYQISSDLRTGSSASMASSLRLKLLDDDLQGALEGSLRRAKRYNSSYAYRDYLGMLHAMDYSKEASQAFNLIVNRQNEPHVWETALVGHHLDASSESDIASWGNQYKHLVSQYGNSMAAKYLLRAGVTDRIPTEDLSTRIMEIDPTVWKVAYKRNHGDRESSDETTHYFLWPDATPFGDDITGGKFSIIEKSRVKPDLAYFAESYRALRMNKFADSRDLLAEASQLYDMRDIDYGYMLPYFAFTGIKSGDTSSVDEALGKFENDNEKFYFYLAKAILTGFNNNEAESIKYLNKALHSRPHTENSPLFTEYVYAEVSEMLYTETGNMEYKRLMLDWVKKVQRFFPWHSWPYAMEAKHSSDSEAKQRAIAMTYYLDKKSERLGTLSKKEIDTAVKKYKGKNPFLNEKGTKKSQAI